MFNKIKNKNRFGQHKFFFLMFLGSLELDNFKLFMSSFNFSKSASGIRSLF